MATQQTSSPNCWICGQSYTLENCKIDEHGRAVHEHCYVVALTLRNNDFTPQPKA